MASSGNGSRCVFPLPASHVVRLEVWLMLMACLTAAARRTCFRIAITSKRRRGAGLPKPL